MRDKITVVYAKNPIQYWFQNGVAAVKELERPDLFAE
jgi:hypothetical protein